MDDPKAHLAPSEAQLKAWNNDLTEGVKAQLAVAESKEAQGQKFAKSMSEEAIRKRKEREEKRAAAARAKALAEGGEDVFTPAPTELNDTPASAPLSEGKPSDATSSANATWTITIPASSAAELSWYSSEGSTYTTIEDAKAAGIWSYPSNSFERAKCAVFRDLWEKGHYMGGGIRFGADFLVYPGKLQLRTSQVLDAYFLMTS